MIDINGMAHVILTVSRFDLARQFYGAVLPFMGMDKVFDGDGFVYWVGGRTALGIQPAEEQHRHERFVQYRVGLHHVCFRAKARQDVDRLAEFLKVQQATLVRGPQEGNWAPGYYYVLFEDPDGIRLELCHVPGQGLLDRGNSFMAGDDFKKPA
jgi:catechol 2,3-dioxygenase-like lactoylglutathione lyase family enzyme